MPVVSTDSMSAPSTFLNDWIGTATVIMAPPPSARCSAATRPSEGGQDHAVVGCGLRRALHIRRQRTAFRQKIDDAIVGSGDDAENCRFVLVVGQAQRFDLAASLGQRAAIGDQCAIGAEDPGARIGRFGGAPNDLPHRRAIQRDRPPTNGRRRSRRARRRRSFPRSAVPRCAPRPGLREIG